MKKQNFVVYTFLKDLDTTMGILVYVTVSTALGKEWNVFVFIFALGCARLPDIDMIPYLLVKKIRGKKMRIYSHWVYGHYPVIFIPLYSWLVWKGASYFHLDPLYLTSICTYAVFLHFVHDALNERPFRWFFPWNKFFSLSNGFHVADKKDYMRNLVIAKNKRKNTAQNSIAHEILSRIVTTPDPRERYCWDLAVISLLLFIF